MTEDRTNRVIIIGAGPSGLTAAYDLCKANTASVVLEKDNVVGGLSRTVNYKGYHFDIGGHRFFTKVKAVDAMWREVLQDDFLHRNRLSRILCKKKFYCYPLRAFNALWGLGIGKSFLIFLSYLQAQIFPIKPEKTFEHWVSNRFGKVLYKTFFKTYTEKVWGIPCNEISAEWAEQRIKGLSLLSAVKNAIIGQSNNNKAHAIKTLIDSVDYPKRGPGMMWQAVADIVCRKGGQIHLDSQNAKILGLVLGLLFGLVIFPATNWLLINEGHLTSSGEVVDGPHLQLLSQFFIGYKVSFLGCFVGFAYGFAVGTLLGASIGWIYNEIAYLRNG